MTTTHRPTVWSSAAPATLLDAYVRASTYLLEGDDFDARVSDALGLFARAAGMEAAALLEFQNASSRWQVLYAWGMSGHSAPHLTRHATGAVADLPFAAERLEAGMLVRMPAHPFATGSFRATREAFRGSTLIVTPVHVAGASGAHSCSTTPARIAISRPTNGASSSRPRRRLDSRYAGTNTRCVRRRP